MKLPRIQIVRVNFDLSTLADALHLSHDEVTRAFRDGRGAWPFSELWGQKIFEFAMHLNSNEAGSDGVHALQMLGNLSVSVKSLTGSGVKFQQSKFVGSRRFGGKDELILSLEKCDRVVVVDITAFPVVDFIPVDGNRLLSAAHTGALTKGGWSRKRFYECLTQTYLATVLTSSI